MILPCLHCNSNTFQMHLQEGHPILWYCCWPLPYVARAKSVARDIVQGSFHICWCFERGWFARSIYAMNEPFRWAELGGREILRTCSWSKACSCLWSSSCCLSISVSSSIDWMDIMCQRLRAWSWVRPFVIPAILFVKRPCFFANRFSSFCRRASSLLLLSAVARSFLEASSSRRRFKSFSKRSLSVLSSWDASALAEEISTRRCFICSICWLFCVNSACSSEDKVCDGSHASSDW